MSAMTGADPGIVRPYQYLMSHLQQARQERDGRCHERNMLVAALSKAYPSHLARTPDSDTRYGPAWRTIVCVHLPAGQVTWHIHDCEKPLFAHLAYDTPGCAGYDGHSTEAKYYRLASLRKSWE